MVGCSRLIASQALRAAVAPSAVVDVSAPVPASFCGVPVSLPVPASVSGVETTSLPASPGSPGPSAELELDEHDAAATATSNPPKDPTIANFMDLLLDRCRTTGRNRPTMVIFTKSVVRVHDWNR